MNPYLWAALAASAIGLFPIKVDGFSVQYTFDGLPAGVVTGQLPDSTRRYPLTVVAEAGGAVHTEDGAIVFPPRCTAEPVTCPRAILEGPTDDAFNPGSRPLAYGATVRMAPTDTADGANVVQKGYSVGGVTQYKLQVDGLAGQPSCVLASATRIYRVVAPVGVADGRWHALGCLRVGPVLIVHVDHVPRAAMRVPVDLSIVNTVPLRIGGKSAKPDNDQFAGAMDDVYVAIGYTALPSSIRTEQDVPIGLRPSALPPTLGDR